MPIAHVCLECGNDLAFERPSLDPVYGMELAWCRRCGRPAARWTHPIWRWWRHGRALAASLAWLMLMAWLALLLGFGTMTVVEVLVDALDGSKPRSWPQVAWIAFSVVAAGACNGIWVRTALGHLRPRRAWLGWAAYLAVLVLVPRLAGAVETPVLPAAEALECGTRLAALLVVLLATVPGLLLGRAMRNAHRAARGRHRRTRRRRVAP